MKKVLWVSLAGPNTTAAALSTETLVGLKDNKGKRSEEPRSGSV